MEDDNGLELSLGLSFGGLSGKSKGKTASSSDNRAEESERGNKAADEFKNFLNAGTHRQQHQQQQDPSNGFQRGEAAKPKENFFNDLSKAKSFDGGGDSAAFEEEKSGGKRRMFFEDMTVQQKKHEREPHFSDMNEKPRPTHISLGTAADEGSAAENEDVAESEAEGSTSRLAHQNDGSKRFMGIGGSFDNNTQKETREANDSKAAADQKRFNNPYDNGFKLGNGPYGGGPFPGQPVNMMGMPFPQPAKEGGTGPGPGQAHHLMQGMPASNNGEGPATGQPGYPGNVPLMFGYPPVQIPSLDKDNSWGLVSQQPQQFHPSSFPWRGPTNPGGMQNEGKKTSEEGSSSAIKPGILAEVKFGGSGSCPNLPWVSTTGQDGRTISGVTYRYNANQIRIVCACHGTHMSTEEFVRHANNDANDDPLPSSSAAFPNPAASAQS